MSTRTGSPLEKRLDVLKGVAVEDAVGFVGDVAEVRRDDDVVEPPQGMVEGQRLDIEHVEAGPGDGAALQGLDEGGLIDDGAARGVDQIGGGFHQAQFARADQAARAVAQD